jgi:hypothetical protein
MDEKPSHERAASFTLVDHREAGFMLAGRTAREDP